MGTEVANLARGRVHRQVAMWNSAEMWKWEEIDHRSDNIGSVRCFRSSALPIPMMCSLRACLS